MSNKKPVKFKAFEQPKFLSKHLFICKKCFMYTSLKKDTCSLCLTKKGFYTLDEYTSKKYKAQFQTELFFLSSLFLVATIITSQLNMIFTILIVGISLLILYGSVKYYLRDYEKKHVMSKLLKSEKLRMIDGVRFDMESAEEDMKSQNFLTAYEKLLIIGLYLQNDEVKAMKINCLNHFILRKDMPLEMDTVVPSFYSTEFMSYVKDALKVQRNLVNRSLLNYLKEHEELIKENEMEDVLINAAGGALRMKQYFIDYEEFIMRYAPAMPKERIIRLCKLLDTLPEETEHFSKAVTQNLIRSKFPGDQEVMAYA
jgi:hypothetical protein